MRKAVMQIIRKAVRKFLPELKDEGRHEVIEMRIVEAERSRDDLRRQVDEALSMVHEERRDEVPNGAETE